MSTTPGPSRLPVQSGERIDRESPVRFRFNNRTFTGYRGDTIASALAANGVKVFTRSFKYHRPRGILTAGWLDPNLMVQVGNEPNVRAGHRELAEGLDVHSQDVWPSLKFDVKAVNTAIGRFLAPGFYYKTFIKPQPLWPAYEGVLKRFVHSGSIDTTTPHIEHDKTYAHPDVVVAGGGPAGMASACAAARSGARVLLVEDEHELGGHWLWSGPARREALTTLRDETLSMPNIEVLTNSVVIARYDDNWLGVIVRAEHGHERLVKVRAKSLVAAPGLVERPYVFEGNDLPGVMLMTGARRLINRYAVKPGARAVVFTANSHGDAGVEDLRRAGVEIVAIVDARRGDRVVRALGRGELQQVEISTGQVIDADLLVTAVGWTAPTSLLNMAGDRPTYSSTAARFFPTTLPDDVLATGGIAGDGDDGQMLEHASSTGREAARRAHNVLVRLASCAPTLPDDTEPLVVDDSPIEIQDLPRDRHIELFRSSTHGFVDYSEDVSSKDLFTAVREGYDSAELAKRYTTATMGPLQGKLETINAVAVIAEANATTIAETGTTVWRPPYAPTTLGALAGRALDPVRYSPMQDWHEEHGARPLVAGAWIRPESYGDPVTEVRAVREAVGIIDVTPIGKLDLQGRDVPALLERMYVNKWQKLGIGRVRYGAMCADDGVVMDDGVTGRLDENHYLMSTTSGGAAAIWEWAEELLQTGHPEWDVVCTPVTTSYASINCAGPRSRELLQRLTDVDLRPDEFGYMNVRTGSVAGVPDVVLWRIGFTGELSFELHVPAAYGLHVWEELLSVGADLGIRAVGIEAQRVLRLEKGHLIIGQDTDGLTQAFSAGLGWAVKLDKQDFSGAPELRWQKEAGPASVLVSVQPVDPAVVPPEASQIIGPRSEILGRVTSSRHSPTLGRSVCLAQLRFEHAAPGSRIRVLQPDGSVIEATVCAELAHFDPEGERARA
ncbi:MAG: 2Fe-2S iron-sulfur cluster-binding protein [Nocardioidaceae bacterium]